MPLPDARPNRSSAKKTGMSIRSQKSAKTSRSRARKRPSIVPSSSSISATKSRARGTPADGDRAGRAEREQQREPERDAGVAPKWKAAVNGRESQRTLQSRVAAPPATVANVIAATSVPSVARAPFGPRAAAASSKPAGDDRQQDRNQHQRHQSRHSGEGVVHDEAGRAEDENQRVRAHQAGLEASARACPSQRAMKTSSRTAPSMTCGSTTRPKNRPRDCAGRTKSASMTASK